jgi:hypothetical protein
LEHGAFEVVFAVDASAEGGAAGLLGGEVERGGAFEEAIDVVAVFAAVVDGGGVVPLAEGVEFLAVKEGLGFGAGLGETIEAPLTIDDADFEEHPVVGAFLLKVEEALLGRAADIGAEDDFPGEGPGAGEGMDVEKEGVIDAAELDGFAGGSGDEPRMALDGDGVAADFGEAIELPEFGGGGAPEKRGDG